MKCRTKTAKQKKAPPKGEKIMAKRVFIIVLDSFGIGEMPDAARFGDVGSNTLGAIVKSPKYHTPTLQKLGLFNIEGVVCGRRAEAPLASFARRLKRKVVPVGGTLEILRVCSHKRTRDDAAHIVVSGKHLPRYFAVTVQFRHRNHSFIRRHLKHAVRRGVYDERACFHMLFAVIPDDVRS